MLWSFQLFAVTVGQMRTDNATMLLLHSISIWKLLQINPQVANVVANVLVEVMQSTIFIILWTRY
jgi:hypothetical protein